MNTFAFIVYDLFNLHFILLLPIRRRKSINTTSSRSGAVKGRSFSSGDHKVNVKLKKAACLDS